MHFPTYSGFNEPIARVSASAFNSAAFNENDNVWIWGGNQDKKIGANKTQTTIDSPIPCEWRVMKRKTGGMDYTHMETTYEKAKEASKLVRLELEAFTELNKNLKRSNAEYIS